MGKRASLWFVIVTMLTTPAWAEPAPAPSIGPKAGAITALLPMAKVVRGSGKTAVTTDAKKGDELIWDDLVRTDKGGRARVTLADQSILSLGSQTELRIVRHDAKSQQTALQMAYGRVRAQVANITRDGGKFELRTPTAVAGVIGTDWGLESSPTSGDTFVCLAGAVQISNVDPSVAGSVQCTAGQTTTVLPGKAPTPPKPASLQQLQQLIEDTEPAMVGSMSPAAALPGSSFDSTIAGTKLGKVTGVSVDGASGVTASVRSASDTTITVHIEVEKTASAGPRTITLAKESGAASATVFTVLGLPTGDPKKAYLDTLDKLRQTGTGGLSAFLSGAQQAADQVAQQITSANLNLPKPLDLSPFADSLSQQYGVVQGGLRGADGSIDKAAQDAANTFSQLYDSAYAGLLQRDPSGNADATFTTALTSAFQQASSILQNALNNSQSGLNGTIQQYGTSLDQIQQTWSRNINQAFLDQQAGPLPKVNALEQIVELGSSVTFSAGGTLASNSSATISSYNWTLCNKSYRPASFGRPLDLDAAACVPLQGFQSNNSDFQIPTCNLEPGLYYVRLAVADSNNKSSQMDVRLTVLEPSYTTPAGVIGGLADAYDALQYSQFIRWFDSNEFNGYTFVAENVRQTMLRLATMSINVRVSQQNVTCNDATVRADWQQHYTFQSNPQAFFSQDEQLSARLHRIPGKGWYIVDFQGDNGRVQGVPGPQTSDAAAPDLVVTNVDIGNGPLNPAAPGNVAPGARSVTVTIANRGTADLTEALPFTMNVSDSKNQQFSTFSGSVPPLAVGKSTTVTGNVTFPPGVNGTPVSLNVSANPGCDTPEKTCDALNNAAYSLQIVNQPDLAIGTFTAPTPLQMGSSASFNVPVSNSGLPAAAGWDIVVTLGGQRVFNGTGPTVGTSQVVNVPVTFTVPPLAAAPVDQQSVPLVITINGNNVVTEVNKNNDSSTSSVEVADFTVASIPTGTLSGIAGRSFSLAAANVAPSPYPLPVTVSYALPQGLAATGSANNVAGATISGTPTSVGRANITPSGTAAGVTHAAPTSFLIDVGNEISIKESAIPSLVSNGGAQNLSLDVTGGVYPVTLKLALPTGITTTSGTVAAGFSTQTIAAPGTVTWALTASFAASTGNLNAIVNATDAGIPATNTPAGNITFNAAYTVAGTANFVITNAVFTGHATPLTGANGLQNGESTQLQVTVANQGNGSPAGAKVFINADCAQTPGCKTTFSGSTAAPAAGASTVVNVPILVTGLPVATYDGSITLFTDDQTAVVGPASPLQFDVVDFTISPNLAFQVQNVLVAGSGDLSVDFAVQTPSGTPFPVTITPATASNLSFVPAALSSTGGSNVPFTANVGAGMPTGAATVTINATNHGVTKGASFPVNFFTAQMTSTTLFVNDPGNPLSVPIAVGAQAPDRFPQMDLRYDANFVGGASALTVQQPSCGNFVATPSLTSAQPNDFLTLPIYASPGSTCSSASQFTLTANIPQTNPQLTNLPVYKLYVTTKGLPQLAVTAATPARDLSNQPWLSGEGLDWTVTVKNNGSGPSAGNEKVIIAVSNGEVGHANLPSSIPAGQQTTIVIHAVLHDVPENGFIDNFMRVSIEASTIGDLSPGLNGALDIFPNVSNWGIQVTSATGADDNTPLVLQVPNTPNGSATIGIKNAGAFNPALSLSLIQGVYSQGQLTTPGISPTTLTAGASSNITFGYPAGATPVAGYYQVQVIAQLKDGGTVTAQRQVTIHVLISSPGSQAGQILLASDRNNIANCFDGCQTPPNTVQINGPLPEAFTLTASLSFCSSGPCAGTADVTFSDTPLTATTPVSQTIQVPSPGNVVAGQVAARPNPDGTISTGPATVLVSVTAIQAQSFAARTPTPDPLGSNGFQMTYNIGDIFFNSPPCLSIAPQNPQAADFAPDLEPFGGFNLASVSWEWQDANHVPVGAGPLSFGTASGSSTLSGQNYPLPTFALINGSAGIDGLQNYFFAVTVSNGTATATKYFPIQVDLSQTQTFCPVNLGIARGSRGGTLIRGSWGKGGLMAGGAAIAKAAARAAVSTKAPDLHINATDVTFTPSMPKNGDTVSVRFRISNLGDADAKAVPVALQVNGVVVAQDTFDVAMGRTTLGGLEWANAKIPTVASAPGMVATSRASRGGRGDGVAAAPASNLQAQIVIDPQHTIVQKSTVAKSAPLAHFVVRDAAADASAMSSAAQQRVVLQLAEGGCAGLKFAYGAGGCSGDVTITVEDLAKGTYKLEATNGIADLGVNNSVTANALYNMNALGQSGHTYAVQLKGGKVGLLTMQAVRNPDQLSEAAKRIFRGQTIRAVRSLGGTSGAPETGDTAPTKSDAFVYFDITFQGM